jgi:hypothetical protein
LRKFGVELANALPRYVEGGCSGGIAVPVPVAVGIEFEDEAPSQSIRIGTGTLPLLFTQLLVFDVDEPSSRAEERPGG